MLKNNDQNVKIYTRDVNLKSESTKKNYKKLFWRIFLQALIIILITAVTIFLIFTIALAKNFLV